MNAPSLPAPAKAGVGPLYALSVLSGLMLGFSFPPSRLGILACVGLVPLLAALSRTQRLRQGLKLSYVAMLVFHVITLNWTGGYSHGNDPYMMIAGAVTMIAHPLFYFLPLGGYLLLRSWRGEATALGALPFLWVGYEYSHSLTEWSFPWLTLGNSQTYDLARIQFITATGVYGLSLWIIVLNIFAYLALKAFLARRATDGWSPLLAWLGLLAVVYAAPSVEGTVILNRADVTSSKGKSITVGLIQSNIDPWDKWSKTGGEAARTYVGLTDSLLQAHPGHKPELVLWPETALPVYLLTPGNAPLLHFIQDRLTALDVSVLTGIEHAEFYPDSSAAPPSARRTRFGERYDAFNAAAFLQPGVSDVPWYGKMKMVPLAERIPYADMFAFLDFMRWGVGIGGWQIGRDTAVFTEKKTDVRFSPLICYESVYPGFVASFVRKGAELITLITIDSWWGRMSGAFQHQQYAVLRAVENRRWIARCAVGGISCYIDPYGRAEDKTELFTRAALSRTLGVTDEMTFYTVHGDWLGKLMLAGAVCTLAAAAVQRILRRKERHGREGY